MKFIIQVFLSGIMHLVQTIRGDAFHYLSAPHEVLPRLKKSHAMMIGHAIPSLVAALYIGLGLIPVLSEWYAAALERNGMIVPITIGIALFPVAIINGFFVERYFERYAIGYKAAKKASP